MHNPGKTRGLMDTEEQSSAPFNQRKLLTVSLSQENQIQVDIQNQEFDGLGESEKPSTIANIIRQASLKSLEESRNFLDGEWKEMTIPINNGSLYDELIFDSAIYLTSYNQLHINTSFGKQYSQDTRIGEALRLVSDVLLATADHFEPLNDYGSPSNQMLENAAFVAR